MEGAVTDPAAGRLGHALEDLGAAAAAGGLEGVAGDGGQAADDGVDRVDVDPLAPARLLEPGLEEGLAEPDGCRLAGGHDRAPLHLDPPGGVVAVDGDAAEEGGEPAEVELEDEVGLEAALVEVLLELDALDLDVTDHAGGVGGEAAQHAGADVRVETGVAFEVDVLGRIIHLNRQIIDISIINHVLQLLLKVEIVVENVWCFFE